jgi:hypothetical protein
MATNGRADKILYLDGQGLDCHLGEISAKRGKSYLTDHLGPVLNTEASKNKRG